MQISNSERIVIDICSEDSVGHVTCEVENMLGVSRDRIDITWDMISMVMVDTLAPLPLVSEADSVNNHTCIAGLWSLLLYFACTLF